MENKIVKKLIDLNAYLTFECSDLTTEEYKGVSKRIEEITNDVLNMHIVNRSLPTNRKQLSELVDKIYYREIDEIGFDTVEDSFKLGIEFGIEELMPSDNG